MPVNSFETYPMSWKPAWNKERPLYQSLARRLEEDIRSGTLLPGTNAAAGDEAAAAAGAGRFFGYQRQHCVAGLPHLFG